MVAEPSRWSTLIIRLWFEDDGGLRARLTEVNDVEVPGRSVAVVDDVDAIVNATRAWLTRLTGGGPAAEG
jgi:hypothetical protein